MKIQSRQTALELAADFCEATPAPKSARLAAINMAACLYEAEGGDAVHLSRELQRAGFHMDEITQVITLRAEMAAIKSRSGVAA